MWSGREQVKGRNPTQICEQLLLLDNEAVNRFEPLKVTFVRTYDLKSGESFRKGGVGRQTKGKRRKRVRNMWVISV